jgi:hypothetical protein
MRTLAIAVVAALGFITASPGTAAELGIGPRYYGGGPDIRGAWREGYYADCSRDYRGVLIAREPTGWGGDYGPNPNSYFLGPIGYHCYGGTYAYMPTITARCRPYWVSGPDGWVRVRRCN